MIDKRRKRQLENTHKTRTFYARIGRETKICQTMDFADRLGHTYLHEGTQKYTQGSTHGDAVLNTTTSIIRVPREDHTKQKKAKIWRQNARDDYGRVRYHTSQYPEFSRCSWSRVPYPQVQRLPTAEMRSKYDRVPEEATE